MVKVDPVLRLTANEHGETKCVIFVDSLPAARRQLMPFSSTIVAAFPFISAFGALVNVEKLHDLSRLSCVRAIAGHTTVTTCSNDFCALNSAWSMGKAEKVNVKINAFTENNYEIYGELTKLHKKGIDGRGVTCAVIDTGIRPHLDFCMPQSRILFQDFFDNATAPYDDNGHGTAVAGILGGNGLVCGKQVFGAAPHCRIASLKAVNNKGEGSAFKILEAMQWIFSNHKKYNIKVLNMSFGSEPAANADPLCLGAEALWRSGVTVVASAGNSGPKASTVKSPGTSPYVITVGGADLTKQGKIAASDFSSRGPAGQFIKPDILAPSVNVATTAAQDNYTALSGTSMASPLVAGVCALILQKKPAYTPDRIKELLLKSALPLACEANTCGKGLLTVHLSDVFA